MNKNKVSENTNEDAKKGSDDIKRGETNPYKYYNISRENLIPLLIYSIVLIIISLVGVFLPELLTKGYMQSHNTIIFAIILALLILVILVIIQNSKHKIWDKDERIQNLKNILDDKDTSFRDLKGKISKFESKTIVLQEQLGKCIEERNILKTEVEHVRDGLQTCNTRKKSYEEMVKPYIELNLFMTEERGKILGILKVDDIYNIRFENKGYAPAFNIEGEIIYFPISGESTNSPISIAKLLPNESLAIQLGGKKNLGDCSKIALDLRYKDILGNIHPLKAEMLYE